MKKIFNKIGNFFKTVFRCLADIIIGFLERNLKTIQFIIGFIFGIFVISLLVSVPFTIAGCLIVFGTGIDISFWKILLIAIGISFVVTTIRNIPKFNMDTK